MTTQSDSALVDELALALDMFLTHHVERDTLACDLTNEELTLMATGVADIIHRERIAAGERVRDAAATVPPTKTCANECETTGQWTRRTLREAIRTLDITAIVGGNND